ncbi:hypothetical protein [Micrococcus luteus]|uniref:hypothetical protein n=1 Tax=Micrococcus luteus TaxID=1270 RepID=UPI003879EAEB
MLGQQVRERRVAGRGHLLWGAHERDLVEGRGDQAQHVVIDGATPYYAVYPAAEGHDAIGGMPMPRSS